MSHHSYTQGQPEQLFTFFTDAVQNCVAHLHSSQQQREHFLVAVIGKDAIQLWWVHAAQAALGMWHSLEHICTSMHPLAMQANSRGLQMLVRWLRTDWEVRRLL